MPTFASKVITTLGLVLFAKFAKFDFSRLFRYRFASIEPDGELLMTKKFQGKTYLDPKYDPAFKELFDSEDAIKDFLNDILKLEADDKIKSLTFAFDKCQLPIGKFSTNHTIISVGMQFLLNHAKNPRERPRFIPQFFRSDNFSSQSMFYRRHHFMPDFFNSSTLKRPLTSMSTLSASRVSLYIFLISFSFKALNSL